MLGLSRILLLLAVILTIFSCSCANAESGVEDVIRVNDMLPCPLTEDACNSLYNKCSSNGKCVAKAMTRKKTCYYCSCDAKSSWGGDSCQYQDISPDFHLLFWVSLILMLAVFYVVGMMATATSDDDKDRVSLTNTGNAHTKLE